MFVYSRCNKFYDLDHMLGYYFMKIPGEGFVSFDARLLSVYRFIIYDG